MSNLILCVVDNIASTPKLAKMKYHEPQAFLSDIYYLH